MPFVGVEVFFERWGRFYISALFLWNWTCELGGPGLRSRVAVSYFYADFTNCFTYLYSSHVFPTYVRNVVVVWSSTLSKLEFHSVPHFPCSFLQDFAESLFCSLIFRAAVTLGTNFRDLMLLLLPEIVSQRAVDLYCYHLRVIACLAAHLPEIASLVSKKLGLMAGGFFFPNAKKLIYLCAASTTRSSIFFIIIRQKKLFAHGGWTITYHDWFDASNLTVKARRACLLSTRKFSACIKSY